MSDPRRALVTGATGFIGSHLVRRLSSDGWQVHSLVRPTSDTEQLQRQVPDLQTHVVSADCPSVVEAVERARPDVCWHLATHFIAQHETRDVDALIDANIGFGARVLEGLARAGTNNLVYTGTAWQHYRGQPYAPTSLYAATKQAFQTVARYYTDTTQLSMVALKLFDTYGPNDARGKLVSVLLNAAASGATLEMSLGQQYIDLTHVDDVVSALLVAADYPAPDGTPMIEHSVKSNNPITLRQLVKMVEEVSGRELQIRWGARAYREHEMMSKWEIHSFLPGWKPVIPLQQGLAQLWNELL